MTGSTLAGYATPLRKNGTRIVMSGYTSVPTEALDAAGNRKRKPARYSLSHALLVDAWRGLSHSREMNLTT